MGRMKFISLLVLCASTTLTTAAQAQSYSYTAIVDPNSPSYTIARGINNAGDIVGFSGQNTSFLDVGGVFTSVNIAGGTRTRARGINNSETIVGLYKAPGIGPQAYIQSVSGLITGQFNGAPTQGTGINDAGSIVGGFNVTDTTSQAFQFVGGKATEIVVPGAVYTFATGINNSGDVVGYYHMAGGNDQGFLVHNNVVTSFSLPGAAITQPLGINNAGEIVGDYIPTVGGNELAFAKIGNVYTLLDVPKSIYATPSVTDATGVNDSGAIVGYIGDSNTSTFSGFLATPNGGAATDIALSGGGASNPVSLPLTEISSISGAIGGGVSSQFYSFNWTGGQFSATLSLTGAASNIPYAMELCSGGTCDTILMTTKLSATNPTDALTGTLTDTLAAGTYTIGLIEKQPGTDPAFTLSFNTPVSGTPEPTTWSLMILGVGGMGAALRTRRRKAVAV